MNARRGLLLLAFIFFCRIVGFLIFSKGFLLKRVVIPDYSVCPNGPADSLDVAHFSHTCNGHARTFKRVVWLLIDALRYDFIVYDGSLDPAPPPYRNKMPFIRDLLREQPRHAKIFKLMADPPTTTMQRLKALTTGGLPTFIDISSNFNSHEILEDNLLHQAKASGRNVTFMGDDTWLGLYPSRLLTKAFDYPSLNVKDLHTVDDGVVAHLVPELLKYDADFVVGHFLGVDHVGHTYGPTHPTMADKLSQLNDVLRSTFASVDEDTIVFVLGDHGMTETGDHGGEGQLETEAGLLVYTKRPIFDAQQVLPRTVYQIDLVPTTALLLGMPIPYSNLGMVIPEVFLPSPSSLTPPLPSPTDSQTSGFVGHVTPDFLHILSNNSEQIRRYLRAYQEYAGGDFPPSLLDSLEAQLAKARRLHGGLLVAGHTHVDQGDLAANAYATYMNQARAMCQGVWARFDDGAINKGMLVLFATLCLNVLLSLVERGGAGLLSLERFAIVVLPGAAVVAAVITRSDVELLVSVVFGLVTFSLLLLLCTAAYSGLRLPSRASLWVAAVAGLGTTTAGGVRLVVVATAGLHCFSLLSNSFILYEGDVVAFLLQSVLALLAVHSLRQAASRNGPTKLSSSLVAILVPFLSLAAVVRAAKAFFSCRDLQVGCVGTTLTSPLSVLPNVYEPSAVARFLLSCALTCGAPLSLAYLVPDACRHHLSLPLRALVRFGLPLASLGTCVSWALEAFLWSGGGGGAVASILGRVLLPRAVFALCGGAAVVCIVKPYDCLRVSALKGTSPGPPAVPAVVLLTLLMSLWIPITLVLNDGVALSSALMVIQVAIFLWIFVRCGLQGIRWPVVISWGLMSCQYFYCLGHTPTVTSLRFEAAFTVVDGDISGFNLLAAGIIVALNTLASQVLFALGLPLLVLLGRDHSCTEPLSARLLTVSLQYTAFHSLKMMVTVFAASLHRRHLMIWGVFSPRFMYEGAFQATTDLCVLLVYALLTTGPISHLITT